MKKLKFLIFMSIVFASCNNSSTKTEAATDSTAPASTENVAMNYPYTIDHPDNWEIGSTANTMVALSALKAFENGDIAESAKYFGDSVHLQFDAFDKTLSNDSLKTTFTAFRNNEKNLQIHMEDWESVISKDKKDEWVTLWYTQKWEDTKGKKDSAEFINDLKIKDGKIVRLDEYTRKLH